MRFLMMTLLLLTLQAGAEELTLRLGGPVRFGGTVERTADGRVWLRTPTGERVVVNDELGFTDAESRLLDYASLPVGAQVTAELASGELRLVTVGDQVVTLLGSGGPVQVPLQRLAEQARSTVRVSWRGRQGGAAILPLEEALRRQAAGEGDVVLPDPGLARLETPHGPVIVTLKPDLVFREPMRIVATLQKQHQHILHMVARSSGDNLAAPAAMGSPLQPQTGDTVTVDIPAGTYQLLGMFGRQAQLSTPDGILQLPFRLLPEEVLTGTTIWVRTYGGEVRPLSLQAALQSEKTESYMLLLPGAPGINPSEVSGFYDVKP